MPSPGYLQDLSQLMEDCLLPGTDTDIALIDDSHGREASCSVDLTPSTLDEMRELDKAAHHKGEADKATHLHPLRLHPLTFKDSGSSADTIPISISNQDLLSLVFNTPPITMTPPLDDKRLRLGGEVLAMSHLPLPKKLPSETITSITVSPTSTSASNPAIEVDQQPPLTMTVPSSVESPVQATTLPTRNTDQVIAELKEKRPLASADDATGLPLKRRLASYPSAKSQSTLSDLPEAPTFSGPNGHSTGGDDESLEEDGSVEPSDEEEAHPTAKPRKITERKRRLNAIADSYMQERARKQLKEGSKVRPEDEAQQSARWLVNQSENREIISSPREYQVELFEKAKEKNIIAVLDTGTCPPPSSIHPANSFRFRQDVDCCPFASTYICSGAGRQSNGQGQANLVLLG
jgi:endoribonuclease Dicer